MLMVKINGKDYNKEQFREWVQKNRLNIERRKKVEAKRNRKSLLKSKSSLQK